MYIHKITLQATEIQGINHFPCDIEVICQLHKLYLVLNDKQKHYKLFYMERNS